MAIEERAAVREHPEVRSGRDTLGGRYMRSFWQPVFHSADLRAGRATSLRIMGQNFTLYRGDLGTPNLVDARCPHRGAQLSAGWVDGDTLRCFYHGWRFAPDGACLEQPAEGSAFRDKVAIGEGAEIHDGERHEWEAGDVAIVHNNCVHQHFNRFLHRHRAGDDSHDVARQLFAGVGSGARATADRSCRQVRKHSGQL